jgi:hypothetical protein
MTLRNLFIAATLSLLAANGTVQAAILNGSFETPVIASASFLNVAPGAEPSGFGWTVVTNTVDIFSVGVLGTTALVADGNQALDLVGLGSTGAIEQSFATALGQIYTLTFAYANNTGSGASSAQVAISDGLNSLLNQSVSHSTSNGVDYDWTSFSANFTATGTTAVLRFTNTLGGNNGGILLDKVAVNRFAGAEIPEPSATWLAAPGLSALALLRKRRR